MACCAVGGCDFPGCLASGTKAQSPTAHTPGQAGTSKNWFTNTTPHSYYKGKQRLAVGENAFGIGFFQMPDDLGTQLNGIRKRLHRQRQFRQTWQVEEVGNRTQSKYQVVVGERM